MDLNQYIGMALGAGLLALGHWAGRQLGSKTALVEAVGAALTPAVTQINATAGSVISGLVNALQQSVPAPLVTTTQTAPVAVIPEAVLKPAPAPVAVSPPVSGSTYKSAAELQAQIAALQAQLAARGLPAGG